MLCVLVLELPQLSYGAILSRLYRHVLRLEVLVVTSEQWKISLDEDWVNYLTKKNEERLNECGVTTRRCED